MRRRTITIVVLLVIAGAVVFWLAKAGSFRGGIEVDAARVTRGTLEVTLPVTGIFETRSVDLAFEIPGRFRAVSTSEGAHVRRGDVLATLDDAELRAAAEQSEAAAASARSETVRAGAAVDSSREQAVQVDAAYRAALANLAALRAGARTAELQQVDAAVEAARVALDQAKRNLAIQEQLYQQGAVASAQVDAARAQVQTAEAQYRQALAQRDVLRAGARPEAVTAAEEQVRQAQAARLVALANVRQAQAMAQAAAANASQAEAAARAAHARAGRAQLRAPFDGVISRIYLNPGAPVAPTLPVLSLVTESGWVTADVDEADIGKVRLGQPGRITADAYPNVVLAGHVSRIGRQVDVRLGTRTVRVRIDLDSPAGLRAGTSVDVDLLLVVVADALRVPLEAVQDNSDGVASVFVIERGLLRRRPVQTGERNDVYATIRSGLRKGELVAIADPALLRDGVRVRIRAVQ